MEQAEQMKRDGRKAEWIPAKEKIWVVLAAALSVGIVLYGLWNIFHLNLTTYHTKSFKFQLKNYGSLARIALFVVLASYVFSYILQKVKLGDHFKRWVIVLFRLTRKWHTPVAIIAFGLITLHAVAAFLYGIEFDFNNITGLLALFILIPVPVAGILRYRRLDRKWHLRFGLVFTVLFLIHAFI